MNWNLRTHGRAWILASAILLILWGFTSATAVGRSLKGSSDFDTFYEAGRAVLERTGTIYYAGEYYKMREGVGPFLYPPIAACFFAIFAWMLISWAAFLWNTALLILFFSSLLLTLRFLGISWKEFPQIWKSVSVFDRLLFIAISFIILLDNLVMAQMGIPILFLCLFSLVLWKDGKNFTAGLVLSCAILLKLTPIFFCLYFLLKRAWKLLAGVLVGGLLLSVVIPTLVFGWGGNRIYHRQWFGRMIKPMLIDVLAGGKKEEAHPLKKSYEEMQNIRQTQLLIDTNQSLPAALTRLFLKDRHLYQVTYRYQRLPVIGGGFSRGMVAAMILAVQIVLLLVLIFLLWARKVGEKVRIPLEVSLIFLSTILLSPIARSHSFIVWVFVFAALFFLQSKALLQKPVLTHSIRWACFLYLLLAIPYGEAVGMGAWANLVLWIGYARALAGLSR